MLLEPHSMQLQQLADITANVRLLGAARRPFCELCCLLGGFHVESEYLMQS